MHTEREREKADREQANECIQGSAPHSSHLFPPLSECSQCPEAEAEY